MKKLSKLTDPSEFPILKHEMICDCIFCSKKETCKYKEEYSSLKDKYPFLNVECKYFTHDYRGIRID